MNKKAILSWLSLVMLVFTSACGPALVAAAAAAQTVAVTPGTVSVTPPFGVTVTESATPTAFDTPTERATATATETAITEEPTEIPESPLVPDQDKPGLEFSPFDFSLQPILGFSFPRGAPGDVTMPIRAAAFANIIPSPTERFTQVGLVEIGVSDSDSEETEPRIFLVTIDLNSREERVKGQLFSLSTEETFDITFQRIPQQLNPERTDSPYEAFQGLDSTPANDATIFTDGACFVIILPEAEEINRYCPPPDPTSPLSIRGNFPEQYAYLQSLIGEVAAQFELQELIDMDKILSMQESVQGLQDCAGQLTEEACSADLVIAPVTDQYFNQQFREKFGGGHGGDGDDDDDGDDEDDGNNGENQDDEDDVDNGEDRNDGENRDDNDDRDHTSYSVNSQFKFASLQTPEPPQDSPAQIDVAVMTVLEPIETPVGAIQPGVYKITYLFDENGMFYAGVINGYMTSDGGIDLTNLQIPTDGPPVTNQQIPAVPATFIDLKEDGPNQPSAQITSCKLFGRWCVLEGRCS